MADPTHVLEYATKLMKVVADDLHTYLHAVAILGADPAQGEFVAAYVALTEGSAAWTMTVSALGAAIAKNEGDEPVVQATAVIAATHRIARIHGDFKAIEAKMQQRFPLFYRRPS